MYPCLDAQGSVDGTPWAVGISRTEKTDISTLDRYIQKVESFLVSTDSDRRNEQIESGM